MTNAERDETSPALLRTSFGARRIRPVTTSIAAVRKGLENVLSKKSLNRIPTKAAGMLPIIRYLIVALSHRISLTNIARTRRRILDLK